MEPLSRDIIENAQSAPALYTVGHGSRSAEDFLNVLRAFAIGGVADVRAYPVSRRHPQFSRQVLAPYLEKAGITYLWLGKPLGGYRKAASSSVHVALGTDALRGYAEHMASSAFGMGIELLLDQAQIVPTAVLCAERLPQHCHRAMIADYLVAGGVPVIHVLDVNHHAVHHLSALARWDQERLVYDLRKR
jgi:uncharacterized protein (DUF488 family)